MRAPRPGQAWYLRGQVYTLPGHSSGPAAHRGHRDFRLETTRCGDTCHMRTCPRDVESTCPHLCVPPGRDRRPAGTSTSPVRDHGWAWGHLGRRHRCLWVCACGSAFALRGVRRHTRKSRSFWRPQAPDADVLLVVT